jgi:hypothetical protein
MIPQVALLPPRAAIEVAVETLLAVLDAMDGDSDQEEDDSAEDDDPGGTDLDWGEAGDCHGLCC